MLEHSQYATAGTTLRLMQLQTPHDKLSGTNEKRSLQLSVAKNIHHCAVLDYHC